MIQITLSTKSTQWYMIEPKLYSYTQHYSEFTWALRRPSSLIIQQISSNAFGSALLAFVIRSHRLPFRGPVIRKWSLWYGIFMRKWGCSSGATQLLLHESFRGPQHSYWHITSSLTRASATAITFAWQPYVHISLFREWTIIFRQL